MNFMNSILSVVIVGLLMALLSIVLAAIYSLIVAWLFMWLWNDAFGPVTGLAPIGYWRAVELLLLFIVVRHAVSGVKVSRNHE